MGRRKKIVVILGFMLLLVCGVGTLTYTFSDWSGVKTFLREKVSSFYGSQNGISLVSDPRYNSTLKPNPAQSLGHGSNTGLGSPLRPYSRRTFAFRRLISRYSEDFSGPPERYIIPVVGVVRSSLVSTFGAARPGGRTHQGTDIFAERGTEVVSATDGVVVRVGSIRLGGNMVMVFGEGLNLYYYAHLDSHAENLKVGDRVYAGQVIGYVGNSGNAATTPPHLHFGMYSTKGELPWMSFHRSSLDPFPFLIERGKTIWQGIKVRS